MIRRLKIKFVCINMLIVTVMLAVIFGMVLHFTHRNMENRSMQMIQGIHDSSPAGRPMKENRLPYLVVTIGKQGIMSVSSETFINDFSEETLLQIARTVCDSDKKSGVLQEYGLRFSRRSTPFGEQIVFLDVSMEQDMMTHLIRTCFMIALFSFVLFFGISILLAQWAIHPVETAWKEQHQFVADASHELKTPLTVIMTNAELLQDSRYESESRNQFAMSILTMSQQMRGLVEGLLNLARVDNGAVRNVFTDLDFSTLLLNCILPFEPLFFEKSMELSCDVEEELSVKGSESHLRQVIDILLDNAVKYGVPTGPVKIALSRHGKCALLCVSTSGDEISKEDLKNIFKRFYRIDKARSMNHSYGLGLSIADSIVKEHNGRIWAESKSGVNSFFVSIPLTHRQDF